VHEVALPWWSVHSHQSCSRRTTSVLDGSCSHSCYGNYKTLCLTYNFLWSGCSDHSRQHLCNWESLAKPKQKGGWGIHNLFHFSKALATNSLWRVLTSPGIWHSIIKDKYLSQFTVISWLQSDSATSRAHSFFWKNLIKSKDWLCVGFAGSRGRATPSLLVATVSLGWEMPPYFLHNHYTFTLQKHLVSLPDPRSFHISHSP
jgi:hypothetical protein